MKCHQFECVVGADYAALLLELDKSKQTILRNLPQGLVLATLQLQRR
mgnify:CR=1 FL=1